MSDFIKRLYQNVGQTLKRYAISEFIVLSIGAIVMAILFFSGEIFDDLAWVGILCLIFGPIVAFFMSLPLYGFGILVERAEVETTSKSLNNAETNEVSTPDSEITAPDNNNEKIYLTCLQCGKTYFITPEQQQQALGNCSCGYDLNLLKQ